MFEYKIIKSNRKTLSVIVDRDRSVVVRAPQTMDEGEIHELVYGKRILIEKKISSTQKFENRRPEKEFISGESFYVLGELHQLETYDGILYSDVVFSEQLKLNSTNPDVIEKLLRIWYKQKAEELIVPRVAHFAEYLGVNKKKISITNAEYTWGSCTPKGNLNFNWRLIKAPIDVIDYIVVHELAHLIEPNHSPQFWKIVSVQLPNYESAKLWLKDNGDIISRDF